MSKHLTPIDIRSLPDLMRLAEEVKATQTPRVLKKADEPVAILMPVGTATKPKRTGRLTRYHLTHVKEALKQSAGALAGVDTTQLLSDIAEQRSQESREHSA